MNEQTANSAFENILNQGVLGAIVVICIVAISLMAIAWYKESRRRDKMAIERENAMRSEYVNVISDHLQRNENIMNGLTRLLENNIEVLREVKEIYMQLLANKLKSGL